LTAVAPAGADLAKGQQFDLRFLDAAPFASGVRVGDWIVSRTGDEERHLWRIAEAAGPADRPHIAIEPISSSGDPLVLAGEGREVEALYSSRIAPGKYYRDVLGLYLLNLAVANSPVTANDREKINVGDLLSRVGDSAILFGAGLEA